MSEPMQLIREELLRGYDSHGSLHSTQISFERRLAVLMEEVGEVAAEVQSLWNQDDLGAVLERMSKELIQVAAVAVGWWQTIENLGREDG